MTKHNTMVEHGRHSPEQPTPDPVRNAPRVSDAGLILLGAAAGRADGLVLPPPVACRARGKALERALGALLKARLVSEVPVATEEQAWRTDEAGNRIGLAITDDGRHAIGMPAAADRVPDPAPEAAVHRERSRSRRRPVAAASPPSAEKEIPAQAASTSPVPGPQRTTRQAQLVDLLSGPAGQSVAALGQAFGWQPHSVRAALTGLRQKGFALAKSKDPAGTTVYRIEPGAGAISSARKAA